MNSRIISLLSIALISSLIAGCGSDNNTPLYTPPDYSRFNMSVGTTYWDTTQELNTGKKLVKLTTVVVPGDSGKIYLTVSARTLPLYHFPNSDDQYRIVGKKISQDQYGTVTYSIDTSLSLMNNKYRFIDGNLTISGQDNSYDGEKIVVWWCRFGFRTTYDTAQAYTTEYPVFLKTPSKDAIAMMGY